MRALKYWDEKHLLAATLRELDPKVAASVAEVVSRRFPAGTHKYNARILIVSFTHPTLGLLYFVTCTSGPITRDYYFNIEAVVQQHNGEWALIDESSYYYGVDGLYFESILLLLNVLVLALASVMAIWVGIVYVCMRVYPSAKIPLLRLGSKLCETRSLVLIFIVACWLIVWFCPIKAGHCGEVPVMKIRFAVYEWDGLGETDDIDYMGILLALDQVGVSWGGTAAIRKIGGVPAYFGLKEATCSFSGRPPKNRD